MTRLQGETGASPTEMRAELSRMMDNLLPHIDRMDSWEQRFMTSMMDNLTSDEWTPTPNQLFKLRDYRGFHKCARTSNGLQSYCKRCASDSVVEWSKAHSERSKEKQRNAYQKARDAVFDHYGRRCSCCGETEVLFLTTDHVNSDGGGRDRKIRGAQMYRMIIKLGFPDSFQVLCWNCNSGRSRNGGICPHVTNINVKY